MSVFLYPNNTSKNTITLKSQIILSSKLHTPLPLLQFQNMGSTALNHSLSLDREAYLYVAIAATEPKSTT